MLACTLYVFGACVLLLTLSRTVQGKEVVELQGVNFELALTSYKYLAVLFFDDSEQGILLEEEWNKAAAALDVLPEDSEMAMISSADPDLAELTEAYGLSLPTIKVFRRGIMSEYRGPHESKGIAAYIVEDAKPSVSELASADDLRRVLAKNPSTIVLGLFKEGGLVDDSIEGYSIDPWGQFQAAADSLRGHASFYYVTSSEIHLSLKLADPSDLPAVYMVSSEGDGFLKYSGEILEINLSEWVLRNSAPTLGELTVATATGEIYATQFFSSRKLKFILFLTPDTISSSPGVLEAWRSIADVFKGRAIFSYMTQSAVADVVDYFDIDVDRDYPMIAAHLPSSDSKFKSGKLDLRGLVANAGGGGGKTTTASSPSSSSSGAVVGVEAMQHFVTGVVSGKIKKVVKSQPLPSAKETGASGPVTIAVGKNVVDLVSQPGKDVLLVVYAPWCTHCRKLIPTYDILGRAVQGEDRIVVAKLDGVQNDFPAAWGVKGFPTLLWFPAKDKPYTSNKRKGYARKVVRSGSAGSGSSSSSSSSSNSVSVKEGEDISEAQQSQGEDWERGERYEHDDESYDLDDLDETSRDEEGAGGGAVPIPRPYWDAGYSLHELVGFVQREGSFDPKSLKIATSEQLGTLLGDEEAAREKYIAEERKQKRNEGRTVYDNAIVDFLDGEIVFDGKRWHVAAAGVLAMLSLFTTLYTGLSLGGVIGGGAAAAGAGKKKKTT